MTYRSYSVKFPSASLRISTYLTPEGKFAQFLVTLTPSDKPGQ